MFKSRRKQMINSTSLIRQKLTTEGGQLTEMPSAGHWLTTMNMVSQKSGLNTVHLFKTDILVEMNPMFNIDSRKCV